MQGHRFHFVNLKNQYLVFWPMFNEMTKDWHRDNVKNRYVSSLQLIRLAHVVCPLYCLQRKNTRLFLQESYLSYLFKNIRR